MKATPIQFQSHDSPEVRLEKLRRLAQQLASAQAPQTTTATGGGSAWLTGHGPPADGLGSTGDFYLDLDTGDVYELEA